MLAVELQPEARIFIKQIIRFLVGRLVFLISRTPPHAVAQAVFGKHQRNIFPGRQFKCRVDLFHPVILVERTGFPVGNIPQISKLAFGERYRHGRLHTFHCLTRIAGTACFLLYGAYRQAEKRERTSFQTNRPPPSMPRKAYSPTWIAVSVYYPAVHDAPALLQTARSA